MIVVLLGSQGKRDWKEIQGPKGQKGYLGNRAFADQKENPVLLGTEDAMEKRERRAHRVLLVRLVREGLSANQGRRA